MLYISHHRRSLILSLTIHTRRFLLPNRSTTLFIPTSARTDKNLNPTITIFHSMQRTHYLPTIPSRLASINMPPAK
ncbi:unnamed protein product [Linum tenue]|uniref:Uncharacterized protein n=1 Tax=Linum tenue TaxID=586396 RepID=A0AAV0JLK2_9ROSI|nr:unnamed protein product [Linum tenue]CAI0439947.1 unnamed protein product [Linum tenue]